MRVVKQHPNAQTSGSDGYSFAELDKAVYEDVHAVLARLVSSEEKCDVWEELEKIFHNYYAALGYFKSEASTEELKHALGAYRCLNACSIESSLSRNQGGDSFLTSLIADDRDFRLVYVLWRWCVDGAIESSGFADLAHQVKDIKEYSGKARSDMKRMRSARKIAADPDSILNAPEDPNFEKLIRVIFSLLRCGRFDEETGVPWLSLIIQNEQVLIDPTLYGAELSKEQMARLRFREMSYRTMKESVAETKYTMGVRMFFAALAGDLHFLLPLATSIEDRLWCYANAAVHARINKAFGIDHPIFAPITLEGIFEAITTVSTSPYYVVMSHLMREAWSEAIEWMNDYCTQMDKNFHSSYCSLHRFCGLIASLCRILNYEHNDSFGGNLVGRMIGALLEKELFDLIPFYATLLPKEDALRKIWNTMPYIRTDSGRKQFIEALNNVDFDGEDIAVQFGKFRVLEDVDHLDCLRWIFLCGDKKLLYAVSESNAVIRHYLLSDNEKEARAVIDECENLKLVDRLASLVNSSTSMDDSRISIRNEAAEVVINEFNNHCLYMSAQAHCTTFALECARAEAAAKELAKHEREGDWSQQGDLVGLSQRTARVERSQSRHERSKLLLDACKARSVDAVISFLHHPGWRTTTDADWARTEQLRALRERYYASILNLLVHDLGMCGDAAAVLDLLPVLADEDLELYKDFSKQDLRRLLLDVHTLAGHALDPDSD